MQQSLLPLTSTQQGIWLAELMAGGEDNYLISHCLEIKSDIQIDILKQAIGTAVGEADTITADYIDGHQAISSPSSVTSFSIGTLDFSQLENGRERAFSLMKADTQTQLSITEEKHVPLQRHTLICISENNQKIWLWYQRYHHIMLDGYSFAALTKRVEAIYNSVSQGDAISESPFTSVRQVIEEEDKYKESLRFHTDKAFWSNYCANMPSAISLSTGCYDKNKSDDDLLLHVTPIAKQQLVQIEDLAESVKSSSAELLMSLVMAYLYRITGQSHQVVGMPMMRRLGSVSITSVAPMVNVLPLHIELDNGMNWLELAQTFKRSLKLIRRHQHYSAEQLQRDVNKIESSGLYSTLINYKQFDYDLNFAGTEAITHHLATGPVSDFEFSIIVEQDKTYFELRGNASKYDQTAVKQHGDRIGAMLTNWLLAPNTSLSQLSILPEKEQQTLKKWQTGRQFIEPELANILDVFWRQVDAKPNATALVCRHPDQHQEIRLTFIELAQQINRLTHYLLSQPAISRNSVIACAMPRSAESVITMMSILNSGATYLPLDLDYPKERMLMMCEDTQPKMLISHSSLSLGLAIPTINIDEPAFLAELQMQSTASVTAADRPTPKNDDIAYVIFTSGSTGKPKGVMNTHSAMLNLLLSHQQSIYQPAQQVVRERSPNRALRAAHTHSFSFDSSWLQIFWLIQGEELYVFDEETRRDAYAIVQEVHQIQIDAMDLPPSLLAQLFSNGLMEKQTNLPEHQPSLILIGGEACPAALWQQLKSYPALTSHNLYGPTEYTVDTLRANLQDANTPIIGRPISNTHTYILDAQLQMVPIGAVGELYISGAGLAYGYLARGALSASRFIADPYSDEVGARMYRTGDLVRWNECGQVEFIGRGDDQVKIRGYRVEIGEVENALSLLATVESAIVMAEAVNGSHRLIAYCAVPTISVEQFEQHSQLLLDELRGHLPDYMVPAALQVMASFPRNVSGKVDKKALPKIQPKSSNSSYVEPKNTREKVLCTSIEKVLKVDRVSAVDDFFSLGGDSISAIMLCTEVRNIGYKLRPSQVFKLRQASAMAIDISKIEDQKTTDKGTIEPTWSLTQEQQQTLSLHHSNWADITPLLPLQKGMLFETLIDSASGNYNAYTRLNFSGEIDLIRLQNSLNALLNRYPQLAGAFDNEHIDEPVLLIPDTKDASLLWPLTTYDLSEYDNEQQVIALEELEQALLNADSATDVLTGMINAAFVNLGVKHGQPQSALILIIHHLVIDGWSTPLLLKSLLDAYQKNSTTLTENSVRYPEVIKQLYVSDQAPSLKKWQQVMLDAQPCILFEQKHDQVSEIAFSLSEELTNKLTKQLQKVGVTLNVFMQSIWAHSLNVLSGKEDIIFGSPVSGRSADVEGIEDQVGLFLNTLPIRVQLQSTTSLWEHLPAMQERHIELLEHDTIGLVEIQQLVGNQTLFDTLLVVENYPDNEYLDVTLPGKDGKELRISDIHNRGYSHYPLALLVLPGDELTFLLENRGALSAEQAQHLSDRIQLTIATALAKPQLPLCHYPSLSKQEKNFIDAVNNTAHKMPNLTLQRALTEQALRTPLAQCLADHEQRLTYQQARQQVLLLAEQLQQKGVKTGDIVAVALPRSCRLSIAIWAIIEVGAAYLPLDISYPEDRLAYMLGDAKPALLITENVLKEKFTSIHTATQQLLFDSLFDAEKSVDSTLVKKYPIRGEQAAYLIYTSGTTGRPKGVMISHQAIINRILWMQDQYQLGVQDVVLQKTPCSFDVSVWEFFWAPMVGASLVMAAPEAHRDPLLLVDTIDKFAVTTLHFVPSMLAMFTASLQTLHADKKVCSTLQQVFCSGEALLKTQAVAFKNSCDAQLHNLYGPTEAAVDVTYKPALDDLDSTGQGVAIGKPVWNTQLRILDQYLRPVPVGVIGELYLCGNQLAIGYLGRPELNSTRFVADPYGQPGDRMYRTGDTVRWLSNGDVEYLGRTDFQIKIRGQRVELGEIESQLVQQANIKQAVVVAQTLNEDIDNFTGQDNRQLIAYLTVKDEQQHNEQQIKVALSENLPAHMLPVVYIILDSLPLSANGKLDRKALPKADRLLKQNNVNARRPAIGIESQLARLFSNLLGIDDINAGDDFFALGGHSLLAMRLASDIRREVKKTITVGQIMVTPTVEKLAKLLTADAAISSDQKVTEMLEHHHGNATSGFDDLIYLREGQGAPLFCFYPGSGFAWQYSPLSHYLKGQYPIIGLQSPRPHGLIASSQDIKALIEGQLAVIRRVQPQGPYYLLGYSLGGTVAYGVAAKLREYGETVNFLGLLDTYPAEVHDWNDSEGEEAAMAAEHEQTRVLNNAIVSEEEDDIDVAIQQEKEQMLTQIFDNYKDAIRLLKHATTPKYDSTMNVFIAKQSLPNYIKPSEDWQPYASKINFHSLGYCSHEDILSPENLKTLGPLLDQLIKTATEGVESEETVSAYDKGELV